MKSAASVKAKLRNKSIETGKTMESLLVAYGIERTICRLAASTYKENFTLKGGIFLYALLNGNFARATTDIDLLAEKISNGTSDMYYVFSEIFSIKSDDPLVFDLDTLKVSPIAEFRDYHGVNVSIVAFLERTRINISIDIGVGDKVFPGKVKMLFPTVFGNDGPEIYAYSLCSCIAEKFEAIVAMGYDNSRFKDFYDLYVLSTSFDYDGKELKEALKETFSTRGTPFSEIVAFEPGFVDDSLRQTRWTAFTKKKNAMLRLSLEESVYTIRRFLEPVILAITTETGFNRNWCCSRQTWE